MEFRQAFTLGELSGWLEFQEKVAGTGQSQVCREWSRRACHRSAMGLSHPAVKWG